MSDNERLEQGGPSANPESATIRLSYRLNEENNKIRQVQESIHAMHGDSRPYAEAKLLYELNEMLTQAISGIQDIHTEMIKAQK